MHVEYNEYLWGRVVDRSKKLKFEYELPSIKCRRTESNSEIFKIKLQQMIFPFVGLQITIGLLGNSPPSTNPKHQKHPLFHSSS